MRSIKRRAALTRLGYHVSLAAPGDGSPPPDPGTPPGTTQG